MWQINYIYVIDISYICDGYIIDRLQIDNILMIYKIDKPYIDKLGLSSAKLRTQLASPALKSWIIQLTPSLYSQPSQANQWPTLVQLKLFSHSPILWWGNIQISIMISDQLSPHFSQFGTTLIFFIFERERDIYFILTFGTKPFLERMGKYYR